MVRAASGPLRLLLIVLTALPMVTTSAELESLTLSAAGVRPGEPVTATGIGFGDCALPDLHKDDKHKKPDPSVVPLISPYISVHWQDSNADKEFASTHPDAAGRFTVPVPTDGLAPGPHKIVAECAGHVENSVGQPSADTTLHVAAVDPPSPPPSSPSSTTTRSIPSPLVTPTVTQTATEGSTASPFVPTIDPTTYATGGGVTGSGGGAAAGSKLLDWVVVLGVVGALVALAALGRRLKRGGAVPPHQPQHTTKVPVVRAVARQGVPGPVALRETGPGHSVSIRIVVREEPGEPVVHYTGGGGPR